MNAIVAELLAGEGREAGQAALILEAARWAASSFARFRHDQVEALLQAALPPAASGADFCSPRTTAGKTEVPRSVGVVFASIPAAAPAAAIVSTLRTALVTRNAIVMALEPGSLSASIEAACAIAAAVEQAGAPACLIQVIDAPSPGLARHLAQDAVAVTAGNGVSVEPETLVTWTEGLSGGGSEAADRQPVLGRSAPMSLGKLQAGGGR